MDFVCLHSLCSQLGIDFLNQETLLYSQDVGDNMLSERYEGTRQVVDSMIRGSDSLENPEFSMHFFPPVLFLTLYVK